MTERLPLSATTTDPVEQALLRSIRRDAPSPQAMQRTAAALGLSATAFAATSSSAGALASSSIASGTVVSLPWIALKAVVIGTLCGSVALVGVNAITAGQSQIERPPVVASGSAIASRSVAVATALVSRRLEPEAAARAPFDAVQTPKVTSRTPTRPSLDGDTSQPAALQAPPSEPPVEATAMATVAQNEEPRVNAVAARNFAPVMATDASAMPQTEAPPVASSMGQEIATVDLARRALREGDAGAALRTLDEYRARWPRGVFAIEVMVLRVETLLAMGQRAAAESLAASTIRAQPTSRYATRLRNLLGSGKSSDQKSSSATGKGL